MKYIFSFLMLALLSLQLTFAQNYAYVYIEGDKQTPFYVKMEGKMMPRLGKNYAILSNLDAGITNIEILFQQNKYPAQNFAIKIPEGGNRGFLLQKVNDRQFALYDLQQGFYIVSGNKPDDDRMPQNVVEPGEESDNPLSVVATKPAVKNQDIPPFVPDKKKAKVVQPDKVEVSDQDQEKSNRFIEGFEFNQGGNVTDATLSQKQIATAGSGNTKKTAKSAKTQDDLPVWNEQEDKDPGNPVAENTGCTRPLSSEEFEDFALKILDKTDDDARIKVLIKSKGKKCFTTEQVRIIANNLVTQSGRYDVVKLLYPQTSDKENYGRLESLFTTNFLKNKFREIINP